MVKIKYHSEQSSPFYRLTTKVNLAKLLFVSVERLKSIASSEGAYYDFSKPKKDGGFRAISAPRDDLKVIQSRIAELLQRIVPPDYLFAPVAGRSYVDNAARHVGAISKRLLDIEDFFPSCTANKVIWLFSKRFGCSPDVASILRGIVTRNGSLPQGSPCSPILAYLCYIDMWEEIESVVTSCGCTLSVYADDLTISGPVVPEKSIWQIKQILQHHGHRYKASKERSRYNRPAEITGVIVNGGHLLAPNRQHQKLRAVRQELSTVRPGKAREILEAKLRGRTAQLRQITNAQR